MYQKSIFLLLILFVTVSSYGQDIPVYKIYTETEETVSFPKLVDSLSNYDVVLFGELHDHPVLHWLQLKTVQQLYKIDKNLVLGAEMFETDNQLILDEYLKGQIPQNRFEEEMRLWTNYKTDYKPLVEFAKTKQLPFIATNVPRRYATVVSKFGIDSLTTFSEQAKKYMAPLPIEVDTITPGYAEMLGMMSGHGMQGNAMNFVEAQALKDATMATEIIKNLPENGLFIHFNGNFHSKDFGGIYWYLKKQQPDIKVAVVAAFSSENNELALIKNNQKKSGNFIILVPEDFTKTY
ncbi:ChaN family lipoprotein [Zunongwangia sp.]|uniref:ChaN family lipoprotein n=1 Tax=Zunongwangia sp. TaxID=1965325 RepID=UPI003AA7E8FD